MTKARDIASAAPAPSTVSATEIGYLDGVTSAIQTQIDSKIGSASAISPTLIDAKGDLIVGSAADTAARLAVGTNNYVLTADSSATNGVKWAAVAAGGFVGCSVYKSSQQTLTNNAETALTFDTENFDTSAFHSTTTNNSRMTIPSGKAGYYLVVTTVSFGNSSTPARAVTLRKNGAEHAYLQQIQPVSNGGSITNGTYILNLAENDYIEIYVRQESGGNLVAGSGSSATSFTIQYLGA